ncbi:hypothetical protein HPB51_017333 [Rhipicephalus microplus]|uniref:Cytochrome n=1 Tax=Rhipicephalus microplus TaxID=6941 RepID=A0A9J6ETU4_RHIMP|nr:hypothetical protein HPB51_017333 [Rhipicephalus microplus]
MCHWYADSLVCPEDTEGVTGSKRSSNEFSTPKRRVHDEVGHRPEACSSKPERRQEFLNRACGVRHHRLRGTPHSLLLCNTFKVHALVDCRWKTSQSSKYRRIYAMFQLEYASVLSFWGPLSLLLDWSLADQRKKCFEAFEGTGVPTPPLRSLINGNTDEFLKPSQIESLGRWLNEYGDVFGFYLGDIPFVVVKDPDMIREIFAKEFNNFNRRGVMPALHDAQREFVNILGECADSGAEVDIGERCERLTFDVISKSAFNLDTRVQRSSENPLFQKAVQCFPGIMSGFMYSLSLNLYHWTWAYKIFHKLFSCFFTNPLSEMTKYAAELIKFRHQNPQVDVPDMAQLLLDDALGKNNAETTNKEAQQALPVSLSQEKLYELATNCMDVFLGGYDTTRLALTFWFYLMGKHPDVQEKMRTEVLEAFKKEEDELSVQTLMGLTYTNQVLSETLRMYPPIITFTTRCADEDYRYGKYLIKKGTSVMVPTYQLHRDPQFWTDPEMFDPDRFSPENKHLIKPGVYQPFGLGVRICVGQRLALLEMASVTSQVLRRFRITHGPSQKPDMELFTYAFLLAPKEPVWIQLHKLDGIK